MVSAYALRLLILTASRTSEVIKAKFEQVDLKKTLWTLPYQNMKARKEHTVPLSNEPLSIIALMRQKHNHEFVTNKNLLITSQKIIADALNDEEIDLFKKANLAMRFLSLIKGKEDIEKKSSDNLNQYIDARDLGIRI